MTSTGTTETRAHKRGPYTGRLLQRFEPARRAAGRLSSAASYGGDTDYYPDPASSSPTSPRGALHQRQPDRTNTDLFNSIDLHSLHKGTVVYWPAHDFRTPGARRTRWAWTAGSRLGAQHAILPGCENICAP